MKRFDWKEIAILFCLLLLFIVSIAFIVYKIRSNSLSQYLTGRCTILTKAVLAKQSVEEELIDAPSAMVITRKTIMYTPDFQLTVQTSGGQQYQAQGHGFHPSFGDRSKAQAIIDQYVVGKTYSCWYTAADPNQVALTYPDDWRNFFGPILPFFFFIGFSLFVILFGLWLKKQGYPVRFF